MTDLQAIQIDREEQFPHLARAPIVEAVIDFRARAETAWTEADTTRRVKDHLPDYPRVSAVSGFSAQFSIGFGESGGPPATSASQRDLGWLGVRVESSDQKLVAMLTRDGFSFSRLAPYETWAKFQAEASRLWDIHRSLAAPSEIARIGVRFINRLQVPASGVEFSDYFHGLGEAPAALPSVGFLYEDVVSVPGHPYIVKSVRTVQQQESEPGALGLLLDIDAICPEPTPVETARIDGRLADLHWLKNRVFFATMTKKALRSCQ